MSPNSIETLKPKILVAEDNPVVSKGVDNFLLKWGYKTILAADGDTAWHILEEDHSIRLALVDWNLPGLSGIQICQRLRTRIGPYVYTIMFSSRNSYEEKIMALDGGADDYLVKPCKPSELRVRLGVGRRIMETAIKCQAESPSKNNDPPTSSDVPDVPDDPIPDALTQAKAKVLAKARSRLKTR